MKSIKFDSLFFIATMLLSASCDLIVQGNERQSYYIDSNGNHVNVRYYESGLVESKVTWQDSVANNYDYVYYDTLGLLIDSVSYTHGEFDGIRYSRRNDTILVCEYVSGIEHGKTRCYFSNGDTIYVGQFNRGKQVGAWSFFYKGGNLKTCEFFSEDGEQFFLLKFSDNGIIDKIGGIPNYMPSEKVDTFSFMDEVRDTVRFLSIPNCVVKYQFGTNEAIIDSKLEAIIVPHSSTFGLVNVPLKHSKLKRGPQTLTLVTEIAYKDSLILSDTVDIDYIIK